jgi:hypothetical protein
MQKNYLWLYIELSKDLQSIHRLEKPEVNKIELCFTRSMQYWNKLKEFVKMHDFENEIEEIQFFKHVKPRFTGLIEYYIQIYRAHLFMPSKGHEERQAFWQNELLKIDKFYDTYNVFYEYYKSGASDQDHRWFLRRGGEVRSFKKVAIYDHDTNAVTSHDWLISLIVAYKKYRAYIYQQLI